MEKFLSYAEATNKTTNVSSLFKIFTKNMADFGFDKTVLHLLTDHKDLDLKKNIAVLNNIDPATLAEYQLQGYDKVDAVMAWAKNKAHPFQWSELSFTKLSPKQIRCQNFRIRESGYFNGVTFPLTGPHNQRAAIGLASTSEKEVPQTVTPLLHAYCQHFYLRYRKLHEHQEMTPHNIILSEKEIDILSWASIGKSDLEISEILKINKHAVNTSFRTVFEKLETTSRIHAVTKALLLGIINP